MFYTKLKTALSGYLLGRGLIQNRMVLRDLAEGSRAVRQGAGYGMSVTLRACESVSDVSGVKGKRRRPGP